MALQIGSTAPDFVAETTEGSISFHEWIGDGKDGDSAVVTIGISQFAVEQLGDLVYIQLPEVGNGLSAGESFAEIESVKSVSDIYCPIAGEVVEVNSAFGDGDNLEGMSSDPFGNGWIAKIKVTDNSGLSGLLSYEDYQKQCAEEH